jgi:hypothetical protein
MADSFSRFVCKSLPLCWSEPEPISVPYRGRWQTSGTGLVKRGSEISGNQTVWDMAEFFVLADAEDCLQSWHQIAQTVLPIHWLIQNLGSGSFPGIKEV